jgi:uncharacterized protein (DUF1015 family)
MSDVSAFKALRPTRDKVHLVAARPYYTYKKIVLKAKLEDNPFTFLHIINPEFKHPEISTDSSKERFELVERSYHEFIEDGILMRDQSRHFYLYRQRKNDHEYIGIIGGASIKEYNEGKIKKHEATLTSREVLFTEYLDTVGYNAEPVLLTYHDNGTNLESIIQQKLLERPEYEFTTTDRITHELWLFSDLEGIEIANEFSKVNEMYIADGHHRSASSARLRDLRIDNEQEYKNEDYFLAYFMNEQRINILEFNRLVKSLNGISEESFLESLNTAFEVKALDHHDKPEKPYEISMCLKGKWYKLVLKEELIVSNHPVKSLIPEVLTEHVLTPILGIDDLRTDDNIAFVSGDTPLKKIEKSITKGNFDVGFILFPLTIEQVKSVADNDMIMPPKSTWIEPKLRSGLTIYKIEE